MHHVIINLMKFIYFILSLFLSNVVAAQNAPYSIDHCSQFTSYYSIDIPSNSIRPICRKAYLSYYDYSKKVPLIVTYTIDKSKAIGCSIRSNKFEGDESIEATYRSMPFDYNHSGYDKGHLAPNADMSWDSETELESFYMTNMAPQIPGFNRGIWKSLETYVRNLAYSGYSLSIVSGAVFNTNHPKIIGNGVSVPTGFFKVITNLESNEVIAFFFPFNKSSSFSLYSYQISLASLESQTNYKFSFNFSLDKTKIINPWLATKSVSSDKSLKCSKSHSISF